MVRAAWLLLAGVWLGLGYLVAGTLTAALTGGGSHFAASVRMARYAAWPFGRSLAAVPMPPGPPSASSVVWLLAGGWWLALLHLVLGAVLCLTVVGVPLGVLSLTLLPVSLVPLTAEVRSPVARSTPEAWSEVRAAPERRVPANRALSETLAPAA